MPNIKPELRPKKEKIIKKLFAECESKGDINFCITYLVHLWTIDQMKKVDSDVKKYSILNDAWGIISGAAMEFYCAVVRPYEIIKCRENGPISQLDATSSGEMPKYKCLHCKSYFVRPVNKGSRRNVHLRKACPHCKSTRIREWEL